MKQIDSEAILSLGFSQSMNFKRLEERNISLEDLKVVVNETEIVPAVEFTVLSRYRKDEVVNVSSPFTFE